MDSGHNLYELSPKYRSIIAKELDERALTRGNILAALAVALAAQKEDLEVKHADHIRCQQ